MSDFIALQHPLLVARAPRGDQWLHEIKLDGYRVQLRVEKKRAVVRTREGHDWTAPPSELRTGVVIPAN